MQKIEIFLLLKIIYINVHDVVRLVEEVDDGIFGKFNVRKGKGVPQENPPVDSQA